MPRRIFSIFAAISLLLCTLLLALWIRSYRYLEDYKTWQPDSDRLDVLASVRGGIQVASAERVSQWLGDDILHANQGWHASPAPPDDHWQLFVGAGTAEYRDYIGFRFARGQIGTLAAVRYWSVRLPFWPLALLSAILPAWWLRWMLRTWTHRRRHRLGLCPTCAYDLRASKDRCPECGSPIPSHQQPRESTPTSTTQ